MSHHDYAFAIRKGIPPYRFSHSEAATFEKGSSVSMKSGEAQYV
jgi:hypothetical protein